MDFKGANSGMRYRSVVAALGVVAATLGTSPVIANASAHAPNMSGRTGQLAPASRMTLAQAPAGLRAAARATLGQPPKPFTDSSFQQAKLTAADAAGGDQLGNSVAISGSTAVVGAWGKNGGTGAAYVFVRSGTTWSEQAELTASDGAGGDSFGNSVAISGSTAVVGAWGKNLGTGAAYVFIGSGTTWSQQAKLTASDGVMGDAFASSVSISGSTVVVGAYTKASVLGIFIGAAYVFVRSGTTWSQQAELAASDGVSNDLFGISVAISGSTAVVGATENVAARGDGAAYVFVRSGTNWTQQAKLTAADGALFGDGFGFSVAFSGSVVVVGAPFKNSGTGAAYVFVASGGTWSQQAELTAADGAANDWFGWSVAISADINSPTGLHVVVGAPSKNSSAGAAYLYLASGTTWSQQAKLTASDGASGDSFGDSVAVSGSTEVVGAKGKNSNTGAAYVFGPPAQQAELTASDATAGEDFGETVAISGSTAVVGAPAKNTLAGAAYVFVRSGTIWSEQGKLIAADNASRDEFGWSVAVSGSTAVVGAFAKNLSTGAAYVFVRSGTTWSQQGKLTAADGAAGDLFGDSVAISGSTAVVGARHKNASTGAAYVFALAGTTWSQQAKLTAADHAPGDLFGDSVAVSNTTAVVGAFAKNSSTGAAYVFVRSGTTWSQQAKLTASDAAPGDAFGTVAISDSTAVVGARGKTSGRGAAYVFQRTGTTWSQQAKLTAPDAANGDWFGWSVAVSGSVLVVGAPLKSSSTGAAYAFAWSGTTWSLLPEITAADSAAGDQFGWSVAISSFTGVVGANFKNSSTGAAYVYG
jgi:FG-GAP repeat